MSTGSCSHRGAHHAEIPLGEWIEQHGSTGPLPPGLVQTPARTEELWLIPDGGTNLRIAKFPVAEGMR